MVPIMLLAAVVIAALVVVVNMYDTLCWGEEGAKSGLVGTTSKGPTGYTYTGDTITVKKGRGVPYLIGLGGTSDTKCGGVSLIPQFSNRATHIYGPGAVSYFYPNGWHDMRAMGGKRLTPGETLTGYLDNANTNEGSVIMADLVYGGFPVPQANVRAAFPDSFVEKITVTSAAAVTWNSGAAALTSALTSSNFLDTTKKYMLLGLVPNVGAATFGGILNIEGLGGDWLGYHPGAPVNGLSAVTFSPGGPYYFPEPIPVDGDEFDSVTVGMTATSAGAVTMGLIIAER